MTSVSHISPVVVDASVAVKWFLPEIHSSHAAHLLDGRPLLVPDLIYAEIGNIFWKRVRNGDITEAQSQMLLTTFLAMPLSVFPIAELTPAAVAIANQTGRSVYDSIYLALAIRESAPMVTADLRLCNGLLNGPLHPHIQWIEDVKKAP
ncbi:MAG: type II toxin-antitoxin system VapC family toxin [Capsulimonas sp.]|uniref:type II toxin-antitoxin system VapC family toxin n=1 Tax=Capsulimonas sp. TaxID=2494211 RepID=UPI0032657E78